VGQFCALKLPQSGSILRAQYHSTPFGFTEVGRRQKVKGKRQKQEVGAQRLSASQRWAEGKRQKVKGKSGKWVLNAFRHHRGRQKAKGKRHKAKGKSRKWVLNAFRLHRGGLKAKGKSRKWVLNAFRHHRGGQKAEGKSGKWVLNALRLHTGGHLLPFTFCLLAFRVLLQSAIQNAKSRIQNHVSALRRS